MMKKVLCILLLAVLAAGCALADAASLTVQGTGSVSLSADTATITLGIRKYDTDVKAAQQAVNGNLEAVIAALVSAGVNKEDIYTSSIYIYPEYNYDNVDEESENAHIRGYSAGNSITVVTGDIESVGAFIDAAFDAGANTLDDVSFSASETTDASNQAMRLAVEDARAKAQVLAEAAGMDLGKIVSMSLADNYSYGTPVLYAKNGIATEDAGAGTQVIASKQSVSVSVTMEYELVEK